MSETPSLFCGQKREDRLPRANYNPFKEMIKMNCIECTNKANVSFPSYFQRLFSYIACIALTTRVKCEKMSLAAMDSQKGDEKAIDVALKHGYSPHTIY